MQKIRTLSPGWTNTVRCWDPSPQAWGDGQTTCERTAPRAANVAYASHEAALRGCLFAGLPCSGFDFR